jgi:cell division protein YceG involved in septum cleavage
MADDRHEEPWQPDYRSRDSYGRGSGNGNGGYGSGDGYGRRGGGLGGILRFLVFAVVLGAIVLAVLFTVLRPVVRDAVIGWAGDSPGALDVPFVADLVREDVGEALTKPASTDTEQVAFTIGAGESASSIAERLEEEGFLLDRRAFVMIAVERELTDRLKTGEFILRRSMTPDELVSALLDPPVIAQIDIDFRTGLRLEQMTAKLQTIDGLTMDPRDFYELAKHPTAELLAEYDWLDLPDGASLEGYLWPATYRVLPDTTGEELVRLMLERFDTAIGGRLTVPAERGLDFHQVLALASLVEREAILDEERAQIAGVYQYRLE